MQFKFGGMRNKNTLAGADVQRILTDVMPEEKKENAPNLFLKCLQISRNASILCSLYTYIEVLILYHSVRAGHGFFLYKAIK